MRGRIFEEKKEGLNLNQRSGAFLLRREGGETENFLGRTRILPVRPVESVRISGVLPVDLLPLEWS